MSKDIKVANINVNIKSFFRKWIQFTEPFHKLTDRPQEVLALLLYHHYRLGQEITNNKVLWKEVFDYDTRISICDELGIKGSALENVFTQLRRRNIIVDGQITPVYIPEMSHKSKRFTITFNFNISYE